MYEFRDNNGDPDTGHPESFEKLTIFGKAFSLTIDV
jgi:hypothetical protein